MPEKNPDAGRPPDNPLTTLYQAFSRQELVRFGDKARIQILPRFYSGLAWFPDKVAFDCLLILEESGRIRIKEWDESSEVLQRLEYLSQQPESDTVAQQHMRKLMDRYRPGRIGADRRLRLTATPLLHLGVDGQEGTPLYLVRYRNALELLATWRRDELMKEIPVELQDLP